MLEICYFYNGGSQLNETARSYTEVSDIVFQYKNFEFVWITDGQGWLSEKKQIRGSVRDC
ncbi:MAG: hypothetical protein IJ566_01180 [Cardiobacteriaceae bacterium]|nr:hypothetical protein [Cardiobacteriaceae bacterium]